MSILSGKIAPGEVLPTEAGLGASLHVSRTAIREAIKVLTSKGLVEVRRKTGPACAPGSIGNYLKQLKGCEPVRAPKTLLLPTARRSPAVFSGVWLSGLC